PPPMDVAIRETTIIMQAINNKIAVVTWGRGGGRGYGRGGRWRNDDREQNSSSGQSTPLAELVTNVKSSYEASQTNAAINDAKTTKGDKRRHIALLFLTIDDLPHEHVWKEWLKSCSSNNKIDESTTKSSEEDNLSSSMMRLQWAMIDLMEEALRIGSTGESTNFAKYLSTPGDDELLNNSVSTEGTKSTGQDIPPVDRFIFVSESCLPVTTMEETEMALFGPKNASDSSASLYDKSWVNARSTPNNGYSRQLQWDAIRADNIPPNYIWKADQWMVLTRRDAEAVATLPSQHLNGRQLWPAFRKCRARRAQVDDFSKGESCAGRIRRRRITYCDWSQSAKNPASFTSQDWMDVVLKARREGCLFARKFVLLSSLRDGEKKNAESANNDGVVSVDDWTTVVVKKQVG
ncbi:hypothetical protein QTG54_000370, partial [Skeletonema marinoi]